jgi:hypothetical protein
LDNKEAAQINIGKAEYELLEVDRFSQSPNDTFAMRYRLRVLNMQVFGGAFGAGNHLGPNQ